MPPKSDFSQQLKELKELLETTNERITAIDNRLTTLKQNITINHSEILARVTAVEQRSHEALNIAKNNETIMTNLPTDIEQNLLPQLIEKFFPDLVLKIKDSLNISKLESQMKAVLIELEDLRNRSMRENLIIKGIEEDPNEKWEDTVGKLTEFIHDNLNLCYLQSEIDAQISRCYRANNENSSHKTKKRKEGPRPVIVRFMNWRFAEEIRTRIIQMNVSKQINNIFVDRMFSKELTARRHEALLERKEYIQKNKNIQIKLDFPATLKSRERGTNQKWTIFKEF